MHQNTVSSLRQTTPRQTAISNDRTGPLGQTMARFPLIVKILGELASSPVPAPGDADIRHGCDRALTSMMSELAKMVPSFFDGNSRHSGEPALGWLNDPTAQRVIDADKLERMEQLIESLVGPG